MMTAAEAKRLALVLASVINAVEEGSQRSEFIRCDASGDWIQGYADGWAAASTTAKVTAARAVSAAREFEVSAT